jgi:hypothetical protein
MKKINLDKLEEVYFKIAKGVKIRCKECGKPFKECIMNVSLKEYKKQVNKDFFKVLDESKKHKKFKKDLQNFIKKTGG